MMKKIITFLLIITSISVVNAEYIGGIIPENIEYCENLYFSNYLEFKNIGCDLDLVEKRIYEVKKGIYNEENYLNLIDIEIDLIYNDLLDNLYM